MYIYKKIYIYTQVYVYNLCMGALSLTKRKQILKKKDINMVPLMHPVLNTSGGGVLPQREHTTKASHSQSPSDKDSSLLKARGRSEEHPSGPTKS